MFLERIRVTKEQEVAQLAAFFDLKESERTISHMPACRGFEKTLREGRNRSMGLIAEVKKASPSKGLIRENFNPVEIALEYEAAGADCLSVLTDQHYFQGSHAYLTEVKRSVSLPVLRKDFIIDYRQIYEARMMGADAYLLIAAMLTGSQLEEFIVLGRELGMDPLVEVHNEEELNRVLELPSKPGLIGINNRNLHTFVTDLNTTQELAGLIPADRFIISESGIASSEEVDYLYSVGSRAVLIGESFMRQPDVLAAVLDLLGPVGAAQ